MSPSTILRLAVVVVLVTTASGCKRHGGSGGGELSTPGKTRQVPTTQCASAAGSESPAAGSSGAAEGPAQNMREQAAAEMALADDLLELMRSTLQAIESDPGQPETDRP